MKRIKHNDPARTLNPVKQKGVRIAMEMAVFKSNQWKAEHQGNIGRKIGSRGKPGSYAKNTKLTIRHLSPVKKAKNLFEDSKGQKYERTYTGALVRA